MKGSILFLLIVLHFHPACGVSVRDGNLHRRMAEQRSEYCRRLQERNAGSGREEYNRSSESNPVVEENCKDENVFGPEYWDVNAAGDPYIQGFARPFSVEPGEDVELRVRTVSMKFRIDVYRVGYYGNEAANGYARGARRIASLEGRRGTFEKDCIANSDRESGAPVCYNQPACRRLGSPLFLADCLNWQVNGNVWTVPSDAVSGLYIARLIRLDAEEQGTATWRRDASFKMASP